MLKKVLLRIGLYLLMFVVIVGGVGAISYTGSNADFYGSILKEPVKGLTPHRPAHDPSKPTVAVVMGDNTTTTEVFDFLIPYTLYSMTEAYNVYAVAPDSDVKSLSGGLEVIPHYTYQELDELLGKSPEIVLVPYMPIRDQESYQPVRDYLKKHASTMVVSICGGSTNLADAGLLKGKSATTHWQAMPGASSGFPDTTWLGNKRYVADGNIVTSGGQTGGFDAVLYSIKEQLGEPVAKKVAEEAKYPTYHFVENPTVDPYSIDIRFATYVLNFGYQWNKVQTGVMLYDGMEEMGLSSVFDTYADTGTTQVSTISMKNEPIVTKHHLNVLARFQPETAPSLDRMFVTGSDAKTLAADDVKSWNGQEDATAIEYLHAESPDRFVFSYPLEDLAKQEDLLTAKHAVKRFEYRANDLALEGQALPLETYFNMLLLTVIAVGLAYLIDRRFIMKKKAPADQNINV